jgi:hypothetical protein
MSDDEKLPEAPLADPSVVVMHQAHFPKGYNFPEEILSQWISIPYDEPVFIGPLTRRALDNLLFSTADISSAVASLRLALIAYSNGDQESANKHLINSISQLIDGETRNRFLFDAIMRSVIEVRKNAGK